MSARPGQKLSWITRRGGSLDKVLNNYLNRKWERNSRNLDAVLVVKDIKEETCHWFLIWCFDENKFFGNELLIFALKIHVDKKISSEINEKFDDLCYTHQ